MLPLPGPHFLADSGQLIEAGMRGIPAHDTAVGKIKQDARAAVDWRLDEPLFTRRQRVHAGISLRPEHALPVAHQRFVPPARQVPRARRRTPAVMLQIKHALRGRRPNAAVTILFHAPYGAARQTVPLAIVAEASMQ